MKQKLDRSLGLFSCITISAGTMIGSAIFVLAGLSYEVAGPSATLAIFLAGVAAIFTGFSFAELVTIVPTAGGGYAYVREATNNGVVGFICGWGFWLAYALSCGIFAIGFGNFLNYFFPFIPQMVGAYCLVIYIIFTNIKGTKSSGKLQNFITTTLIMILLAYIIYGIFHVDLNNQVPYFPNGLSGMFSSMGFLYMTYVGYGLITTASEEVINPKETIPKAIMISLVFVIFIKTGVFFIGNGILHWEQLLPHYTNTPLTDSAIKMAGYLGGTIFAFAGILATLSSINTAVMASSRTAFALSRDNRFPVIFKVINSSTKTPIFSILITGVIIVFTVAVQNLEHISTVISIFSLTGYTLVNIALIIFRKKKPNIERKFKAPLYPLTPIIGILVNIFLVIQLARSDIYALIISVAIICIGLIYFYWGIPTLEKAPKGISTLDVPILQIKSDELQKQMDKVFIPVANPKTVDALLNLGIKIAKKEKNTQLVPLHVTNVPDLIPLDSNYLDFKKKIEKFDKVLNKLIKFEEKNFDVVKTMVVFGRDTFRGIISAVKEEKPSLLIMGWHPSGLANNMRGGIITKILEKAPTDICLLKDNNLRDIKNILFPYGGGRYSQLTAKVVKRIAKAHNAKITVVKIVDELHNEEELQNQIKFAMDELGEDIDVKIVKGKLTDEVVKLSKDFDLLVVGASLDWGMKEYITGLRTDEIVEKSKCSALVVKSYFNVLQMKGLRLYVNKFKQMLHKI